MLDDDRIRKIEARLEQHLPLYETQAYRSLVSRVEDLEKAFVQLRRSLQEEADLHSKDYTRLDQRIDQHIFQHREVSADGYARAEKTARTAMAWGVERTEMLRVVRKNGARFKVRAQDLPHVVLYNGDRVERA